MDLFQYDSKKQVVTFFIKVTPGSKSDKIKGYIVHEGKALIGIYVKEKPIDGRANKAVLEFLSSIFELPKKDFEIKSGLESRIKHIKIYNAELDYLNCKFDEIVKVTK